LSEKSTHQKQTVNPIYPENQTKGAKMSDQKISLSNQQQAQPGETGYVVPSETVPLPSKGKVYPIESHLANVDTVEIRSMTAKDEDILTSRALLKQGKAISVLLKSCLVDKTIDPEQMLAGDRNAALIAIRVTGYGADYETEVECPKCDEKCRHTFNLSSLPIKNLGADPVAPNQNAFAFRLPVSGKDVVFKLLNGADERDLSLTLERAKKAMGNGGIESAVTTRLAMQVLSIGGETDRAKIMQIVRNLPARDSRDLRKYIDQISPGVEMTQVFVCETCNEESEVDVPMGTEFFWPSK
jgi:hypothetical protein